MPRLFEIIDFLRRFAPLDLAEDWDNVGLLLGDSTRDVTRVLTCLSLTPDVADEAIKKCAGLIVTHHPILFRPVKRISADDPQGKMLLELIGANVAVYSPHTAYDSAPDGINEQLARTIGLTDIEPLRPAAGPPQCKIVTFVPRENLSAVQEALWSTGAGIIGEYAKCSFVLDGTGTFLGSDATNPAIGQAGRLETVVEVRLEVVCAERHVKDAIRALRAVHPYEEPAFDVFPLKGVPSGRGAGRVGTFSPPAARGTGGDRAGTLEGLIHVIKDRLRILHLPHTGPPQRPIKRVAVACGSGGEFLNDAIAAGCDAFLTGEARFHSALEARTAGIALLLAGHYATERPAMEYLAEVLRRQFAGINADASQVERDPLEWA